MTRWIDLHIDTLQFMVDEGTDPLTSAPVLQTDLPRQRYAGVMASVWAAWVDQVITGEAATTRARVLIEAGLSMIRRSEGRMRQILTPGDLQQVIEGDVTGVILGMEGATPLRGSFELLEDFYTLGLRVLTLTWNHSNHFATGCRFADCKDKGLTDAGYELIERLQSLGILIDLAHASPQTRRDALTCLRRPFMVSHTNCRALHDHVRNLTDDEMGLIAASGGLIGISIYPGFISENQETVTIKNVVDHIEHAVAVAGDNAVAIGTDFDGITSLPVDMSGAEDLPGIADELVKRGWSMARVEKIGWRNAERVITGALGQVE